MTFANIRSRNAAGFDAQIADQERLEYVAALLGELKGMVNGAGTGTLRGLVTLAQDEAAALADAYQRKGGRNDA